MISRVDALVAVVGTLVTIELLVLMLARIIRAYGRGVPVITWQCDCGYVNDFSTDQCRHCKKAAT